ncbi:MAG: hypothetical protein HQM08_24540 [Candidatus Riflebacteria bacterium]|nr:hypothetical protein [Candidatus Riflebacteria bacterium]
MAENMFIQKDAEDLNSKEPMAKIKRPWRAPRQISIEMVKQTMSTTGSGNDSGNKTSP